MYADPAGAAGADFAGASMADSASRFQTCGPESVAATYFPISKPGALPTNASEGECSRPRTRLTVTPPARPYTAAFVHRPGCRSASTEASAQAAAACEEGK